MSTDDQKRSAVTRPPPLSRDEDNPPLQKPLRGESIARIALRAPKIPSDEVPPSPESAAFLRALAATEGKVLAELSDRREAFEAQMRKELTELVIKTRESSAPPPAHRSRWSLPPKDTSWVPHLPATLMALAAIIATIAQSCSHKQELTPELTKRLDDIGRSIDAVKSTSVTATELQTYKNAQYAFALDQRAWISDVLERAASVKVDDPPGAPKRDHLQFYPPPMVDPHRVTPAPVVQPHAPYPLPPQP